MSERMSDEQLSIYECCSATSEPVGDQQWVEIVPALLAEIRALKQERDEARKTAALEALKIVGESMRMYWELSKNAPDFMNATYNSVGAHQASSLQDQIIQHFQLPPTARIEVDDRARPVPPNLLENAS